MYTLLSAITMAKNQEHLFGCYESFILVVDNLVWTMLMSCSRQLWYHQVILTKMHLTAGFYSSGSYSHKYASKSSYLKFWVIRTIRCTVSVKQTWCAGQLTPLAAPVGFPGFLKNDVGLQYVVSIQIQMDGSQWEVKFKSI